MKTAKLPPECLPKERRLISDLVMGESGYAWLTALIVTPDHDCFNQAARMRSYATCGFA